MSDYPAIRALPKLKHEAEGGVHILFQRGSLEGWLQAGYCEWVGDDYLTCLDKSEERLPALFEAVIEAQALLSEYEAQSRQLKRAVELLGHISKWRDELWESSQDEIFERIGALLHELEGER